MDDVSRRPLLDSVVSWLGIAAAGIIPLVVTPSAYDPYRLPKEMTMRAFGIAIMAVLAMRLLVTGKRRVIQRDAFFVLFAAILFWTVVAALFSRSLLISAWSVVDVLTEAAIVFSIYAFSRQRWRTVVNVMMAAAIVNALSCVLARIGSSGFFFAVMQGRSIGLLGSANDAGGYLAIMIVIALAMAVAERRLRWLYASLSVLLIAALFTTQTLGALAAIVTSSVVMTFVVSRRRAIMVSALIVFAAVATLALYTTSRTRVSNAVARLRSGQFHAILPERAPAFLSAWEMVRDRPLTGVGPGCFGFEYFPYRLRAEERHPQLKMSDFRMENYADAHNDHLQTLAQVGVPGYLLFVTAVVWLGSISLRPVHDDGLPERFAHVAALPLAVCFAIVTLAEFVLELAAPATTVLIAATLCLMFRGDDAIS